MPTQAHRRKIMANYKDKGGEDQEYEADEFVADGINEPLESPLGQIKNLEIGKAPAAWERLDAREHAEAFPISGLGSLPEGHAWYIKAKKR